MADSSTRADPACRDTIKLAAFVRVMNQYPASIAGASRKLKFIRLGENRQFSHYLLSRERLAFPASNHSLLEPQPYPERYAGVHLASRILHRLPARTRLRSKHLIYGQAFEFSIRVAILAARLCAPAIGESTRRFEKVSPERCAGINQRS